jgi:acyl-coenzyme A synthetase/AMP-(fatty) acid ligase
MLFVTPVPAFALLFVGSLPLDVPGSSAQDRGIAMASIERSIEYSLADQTVRGAGSYEEACARHVWKIPPRYNIALDVCDRHAGAGRRALVREGPEGPGETYTLDDLERLSDRLASGLRSLGVGRGDRVALMPPQTPEHAVAHLAIFKLGAISVPLSRLFGLDALRYRLVDSGTCVLLVDRESLDKALGVRSSAPGIRHLVLCDRQPARPPAPGVLDFRQVMERGRPDFEPVPTEGEAPALLIYTSGTTGPPKGALHAHRYLLGYNGIDYANNSFREGDLYWSPADWAWVGGLLVGLFCPLAHGVPVLATSGRFDPAGALPLMTRHGVTTALLSATALRKMAVQVNEPRPPGLRLRCVLSGGERVTPEIEGCLLEHPAVEQCAVIGVPDLMRGEAVKAFVQLAPQFPPSPGLEVELREHVGRQLGAFQRPRDIQWVPELPMTVSGKIRRAELRARADAEGGRS